MSSTWVTVSTPAFLSVVTIQVCIVSSIMCVSVRIASVTPFILRIPVVSVFRACVLCLIVTFCVLIVIGPFSYNFGTFHVNMWVNWFKYINNNLKVFQLDALLNSLVFVDEYVTVLTTGFQITFCRHYLI